MGSSAFAGSSAPAGSVIAASSDMESYEDFQRKQEERALKYSEDREMYYETLRKAPGLAFGLGLGAGFGSGCFYAGQMELGTALLFSQIVLLVLAAASPTGRTAALSVFLGSRLADGFVGLTSASDFNDELDIKYRKHRPPGVRSSPAPQYGALSPAPGAATGPASGSAPSLVPELSPASDTGVQFFALTFRF
jgi:hypothetical protein